MCQQETGHGRKEVRIGPVVSAKGLAEHHEFPGLKAFSRIESRRETDGRVRTATRYFAPSWVPVSEVFMACVRAHWGIENALHWQLDVSFREDAARNRKDNGPANIAILRRRALDVARRDTSKGSLSIKLKRAGWDDAFLLNLLNRLGAKWAICDCPVGSREVINTPKSVYGHDLLTPLNVSKSTPGDQSSL